MYKIIAILVTIIFLFSAFTIGAMNVKKNDKAILGFDEEYDMVIIAPELFSSNLQVLLNHKNNRGLQTVLKTVEEIYAEFSGRDSVEQIKYFIKYAIETWNIDYVLLVGGVELIPGRYVHVYFDHYYQNEWVFLSDLYYADIYDAENNFCSWDSNENDVFGEHKWYGKNDDLDLYPDVYLGRLACVDNYEVDVVVEKIINYETGEAYASEWFKNVVLIGGDSLPGDPEHIDEGEYVNQQVMKIMNGFSFETVWASNGKLSQSINIDNAINNGAGFVFFNGHGHFHTWATHPHERNTWIPLDGYGNDNLNGLSNGNKLPIVISDACFHCAYDRVRDCFGWTFVTNPNGGCIGFLGGTDVDESYGGVDIITKGIERLCLLISSNYMQGVSRTFGDLWGDGIHSYLPNDMDEIDHIIMMEFQPFGDPSLQIAAESNPPNKPDRPDGPTEGEIDLDYTYTTSAVEPDGEQIFFKFDWGDETNSGWLGPYNSGDIVSSLHNWTEQGSYEIRVIAKDEHGVLSEWSDILAINMPKNKIPKYSLLSFLENLRSLFIFFI
jgi:hypothetical protein